MWASLVTFLAVMRSSTVLQNISGVLHSVRFKSRFRAKLRIIIALKAYSKFHD